MYNLKKLSNGLTLITIPIPALDSVTSLIAVGAGSRYENKQNSGISHFLEHMFFKGSRKYPTAEIIANLVDGLGAANNAATSKEFTYYWIKSASKHMEVSMDVLSSMLKESLLAEDEIEKEKGVIAEELRMYKDVPSRYVSDLYERLHFGDQPLGWDVGGEEAIVNKIKRQDFVDYMNTYYSAENMVVAFAGNIPANIEKLAEEYFGDLPSREYGTFVPYKREPQTKPKVNIFYKQTDQANLILGVDGYDRNNPKKYAARVLGTILGEGMSSRLFIQVRERRGLAYSISAGHDTYVDTGVFEVYAGLKLEKIAEGLEVIKTELERTVTEKVTEDELKKAKEMIRGRIALRSESTNFLAEHFAIKYILDRELESFEDYLKNIDKVTADDIKEVAAELFISEKYNLQIIAPLKNVEDFEKILSK